MAQAQLDLERTEIKAPFDALVLSESVEVGGQAVVGAELARMVDRSRFSVEVSVPAERLDLLQPAGAAARTAQRRTCGWSRSSAPTSASRATYTH